MHCTVLKCCVYEKRAPHIFENVRRPVGSLEEVFYLPKLLSRLFSETKDW